MRLLLSLFLSLGLGAVNVTLVQTGPTAHSTSTGNSISASFALTPSTAAGEVIAVAVSTGCGTVCGNPVCTDGPGNTYTEQASTALLGNPNSYWYTAPVHSTASPFTVTCTQSGSANAIEIQIFELSNAHSATASATYAANQNLGNGAGQIAGCSIAVIGNALVLGVALQDDSTASSIAGASGGTLLLTDVWASANNFSTGTSMTVSQQTGGVSGTYTPGWSMTMPGAGGPFHIKVTCIAINAPSGKTGYVYSR